MNCVTPASSSLAPGPAARQPAKAIRSTQAAKRTKAQEAWLRGVFIGPPSRSDRPPARDTRRGRGLQGGMYAAFRRLSTPAKGVEAVVELPMGNLPASPALTPGPRPGNPRTDVPLLRLRDDRAPRGPLFFSRGRGQMASYRPDRLGLVRRPGEP